MRYFEVEPAQVLHTYLPGSKGTMVFDSYIAPKASHVHIDLSLFYLLLISFDFDLIYSGLVDIVLYMSSFCRYQFRFVIGFSLLLLRFQEFLNRRAAFICLCINLSFES